MAEISITVTIGASEMVLISDGLSLTGLYFKGCAPKKELPTLTDAVLRQAKRELLEYFEGERKSFTVPLRLEGTAFQKKVWAVLLEIPYGETRSYEEVAVAVGSPKACRAVGLANNKNPISIFVPCHRVIGKNGTLVGYGGGLSLKEELLLHEKNNKDKVMIC